MRIHMRYFYYYYLLVVIIYDGRLCLSQIYISSQSIIHVVVYLGCPRHFHVHVDAMSMSLSDGQEASQVIYASEYHLPMRTMA